MTGRGGGGRRGFQYFNFFGTGTSGNARLNVNFSGTSFTSVGELLMMMAAAAYALHWRDKLHWWTYVDCIADTRSIFRTTRDELPGHAAVAVRAERRPCR